MDESNEEGYWLTELIESGSDTGNSSSLFHYEYFEIPQKRNSISIYSILNFSIFFI